jgi:hypothetical protein
VTYELRGRRCETVFRILSLIAVEEGRGFLKLALELQVLRKVAHHVDLLLEIVQVLLLAHHCTVICAYYINT